MANCAPEFVDVEGTAWTGRIGGTGCAGGIAAIAPRDRLGQMDNILNAKGIRTGANQAWKELPQPQDFTAFGLSNVNPRFSMPSKKSTVVPSR